MRAIIAAAILALSVPAQAQPNDWRAIEHQCADQVNAQYKCASCAGLWPYWLRCTVLSVYGGAAYKAAQPRIAWCVHQVEQAYAGKSLAHGDRVGDGWRCITGE